MSEKIIIDNKQMKVISWLICKNFEAVNNFLLNELIDSIFSNDNIKLSGESEKFNSSKGNEVTVFCPDFYLSEDQHEFKHIPLYEDCVNYLNTIEYFDMQYNKKKFIFSTASNNEICEIIIPNWDYLSKKISAFCSFLKYVDEQISDSSNFHYKLKIFQLFNNHKNNSEDYKIFEKEIFNSIAENTYKLTLTEKYIDVNEKECDGNSKYIQNYHAITMYNIFVRAYNKLTNDERFEIFSSIRKNTDDFAESLLDDIDKIDKESDYSEKDGDK